MSDYVVKTIPSGYKFTWAISSMNTYLSCPRRFAEEYIHKNKQKFSAVAQWGVDVHDALEGSVKAGCVPLTPRYEGFQYVVDKVRVLWEQGWQPDVEAEHCMNRELQPVSWFSKEAWVRCKVDLCLVKGEMASVIDYKTGAIPKPQYQSYEQLRLSNLMVFAKYPEVQVIKSKYWYIAKDGAMSKPVRTERSEMNESWDEFFYTTNDMEGAVANNDFPPKQNGLCRAHCHVTTCQFNGRR